MARKNLLDTIDEVAKGAEIKANPIEMINISDDKLIDYPDNNEDVSYTEDLEVSMEENGFTDPIEVTDFGMKPGFYMIISGHRRRVAGRKKGYKTFPCIVRHFKTKKELKNFVLMSNAYRNTENDPLLYSTRYKMHEQYLKESGFKGSFMQEIAKRLGMTVKSLEKYKQMNKVIMPVWDMVRSGTVGMSSVLFMATYSVEEQEEIYNIFQDNLAKGITLTRDRCKEIKREYELKDTVAEEEEQITIETLEDGKYMPEPVKLPAEEPVSEPEEPVVDMPKLVTEPAQASTSTVEEKQSETLNPLKVKKLVEEFKSMTQKATRKNVLDEMEKRGKTHHGHYGGNVDYQMKPGKVAFDFSNVYHTFHSILSEYEKHGGTFEKEPENIKGADAKFANANSEKLMHYMRMVDASLDEYTLNSTNEAAVMVRQMNVLIIDCLCEIEKIGKKHNLQGHCMGVLKDSEKMINTIYGRN